MFRNLAYSSGFSRGTDCELIHIRRCFTRVAYSFCGLLKEETRRVKDAKSLVRCRNPIIPASPWDRLECLSCFLMTDWACPGLKNAGGERASPTQDFFLSSPSSHCRWDKLIPRYLQSHRSAAFSNTETKKQGIKQNPQRIPTIFPGMSPLQ